MTDHPDDCIVRAGACSECGGTGTTYQGNGEFAGECRSCCYYCGTELHQGEHTMCRCCMRGVLTLGDSFDSPVSSERELPSDEAQQEQAHHESHQAPANLLPQWRERGPSNTPGSDATEDQEDNEEDHEREDAHAPESTTSAPEGNQTHLIARKPVSKRKVGAAVDLESIVSDLLWHAETFE